MDIHQPNTDDLRRIADQHPHQTAWSLAVGIEVLAVQAAKVAKGTRYEAAVRGPVNRIVEACLALHSIGGPAA